MSRMLRFDPSGAFRPGTGLEPAQLAGLEAALKKLREEVCDIDVKMHAGSIATPVSKQPLEAGFYLLPEQQLGEYVADRQGSELARVLAVTKTLMSGVDRIVVLGAGGSSLGARALMDACCQPYFNELSRGQRGSRPRIYFDGDSFDNDASQGLLCLLGAHRGRIAESVDDSWGIVAISKSGQTHETEVAFSKFLSALETSCGGDAQLALSRLIPVTGVVGRLRERFESMGCEQIFLIRDGVASRYSALSTAGLVPAALMGINVMKLLEGAAAMNDHFRTAKVEENMVLQLAATNYLLNKTYSTHLRALCVWSKSLESFAKWYCHLVSESLGMDSRSGTTIEFVCPRDLHCGNSQNGYQSRECVFHNLVVDQFRFDPLFVDSVDSDEHHMADTAQKVEDLVTTELERTNQAYAVNGCPTTNLYMPRVDEHCMGQLMQLMMLATVIEGRLLGINPYQ